MFQYVRERGSVFGRASTALCWSSESAIMDEGRLRESISTSDKNTQQSSSPTLHSHTPVERIARAHPELALKLLLPSHKVNVSGKHSALSRESEMGNKNYCLEVCWRIRLTTCLTAWLFSIWSVWRVASFDGLQNVWTIQVMCQWHEASNAAIRLDIIQQAGQDMSTQRLHRLWYTYQGKTTLTSRLLTFPSFLESGRIQWTASFAFARLLFAPGQTKLAYGCLNQVTRCKS